MLDATPSYASFTSDSSKIVSSNWNAIPSLRFFLFSLTTKGIENEGSYCILPCMRAFCGVLKGGNIGGADVSKSI